MSDTLIPEIPTSLVEWLEETFPNRLPDVETPVTMEQINIMRGRQDIIDLLRIEHDAQMNPPFEE